MSLQRIFARGKAFEEKESDQDYKKEDITVRFYRSLARPVVSRLDQFKIITPNRLTWFGFFWVILGAGILILAEDNIFLLLSVGLCYWISGYVDTLDGMLARLRNSSSKNGEWLDTVLEEGKGLFFFFALGLHIQDNNGNFMVNLFQIELGPFNVWMVIFVMYGVERWIALMAVWGNVILDEPRVVSFGNIYIVGIFLLLNQLELFLFLFTVGVILAATWTLIEKTFFFSEKKKQNS
ncbi:MAG: CDP-alcohol phosphatidyltransferase family protein [Candidatus Hodarchaeales archaeon]|jgi:phosphatidylglycerophosphate synthase